MLKLVFWGREGPVSYVFEVLRDPMPVNWTYFYSQHLAKILQPTLGLFPVTLQLTRASYPPGLGRPKSTPRHLGNQPDAPGCTLTVDGKVEVDADCRL